jgi:hypothetical protein
MPNETSPPRMLAGGKPPVDTRRCRVCGRPGCEVVFEARAHNHRYCSLRCKRWVSNHSPRHLAAKQRHDLRRRESGLKAMQDARWYANGGWSKQSLAQLQRRLAEKLAYRDELMRQDAAATGERDVLGRIWQ